MEQREINRLLFVAYMEDIAVGEPNEVRCIQAETYLADMGLIATDYIECFELDYQDFISYQILMSK